MTSAYLDQIHSSPDFDAVPITENGLGNRDIFIGTTRYLPLVVTAGQPLQEVFNLHDAGGAPGRGGADERMVASFRVAPSGGPTLSVDAHRPSGDSVVVQLTPEQTQKLGNVSARTNRNVGEWRLDLAPIPPAMLAAHLATRLGPLATGSLLIHKQKKVREWIPYPNKPGDGDPTLEINMQGVDRGNWQGGVTYHPGDVVTHGGRQWFAVCEAPGAPTPDGPTPNAMPGDYVGTAPAAPAPAPPAPVGP